MALTLEQKLFYQRKKKELQGTDQMKEYQRAELRQYEGTMSRRWFLIESGQYKPTAEEAERDRQRWNEAQHREAEAVRAGKWKMREDEMYIHDE